jgi:flagellar motor switch protein FliG
MAVGGTDGELAGVALERIPGRRKAAVLIAALGPELSASVIKQLADDEVEALSLEMSRLDSVGTQTAETIMAELAALAPGQQGVSGGIELTRAILEKALGTERAIELVGRLSSAAEVRPFEYLRRAPADQIANLVAHESAQTAALILANLPGNLAAQVLARLPESDRPEIAMRIVGMGQTSSAVLAQIEEIVRRRLTATVQQDYSSAGGVDALAEILSHSDRATERAVLSHIGDRDEEMAEEVRRKLFVFEDLIKLDDRALQQVLREADQKDLVLALRGVADEVKGAILKNMSERGAEMLNEELELQQPQRKTDVEAAQGRIVGVVRRLEDAGTIVISSGDPEDEEADVV